MRERIMSTRNGWTAAPLLRRATQHTGPGGRLSRSIFVLDLKLIRWDAESPSPTPAGD